MKWTRQGRYVGNLKDAPVIGLANTGTGKRFARIRDGFIEIARHDA